MDTLRNANVIYHFDKEIGYGLMECGKKFIFDACDFDKVKNYKWYYCVCQSSPSYGYITNKDGVMLHTLLIDCPKGYEIDHINLNTLDNRHSNLRICTHQQNQMNQPLQKNNTSGVTGVSYYPRRRKYTARIKISQKTIHLGYYLTFEEAVQARNVAMECMFGEYGRYNDVPPAPNWIREKVIDKCMRFAELSVCRALLAEKEVA